ncbi:hypothetical protein PG985_009845 [Apiospora marii]|uniref:uncharacterized protein n=1 Tax=Apiospora marii TaxID=335849 RepID=UPI00312ED7F9
MPRRKIPPRDHGSQPINTSYTANSWSENSLHHNSQLRRPGNTDTAAPARVSPKMSMAPRSGDPGGLSPFGALTKDYTPRVIFDTRVRVEYGQRQRLRLDSSEHVARLFEDEGVSGN